MKKGIRTMESKTKKGNGFCSDHAGMTTVEVILIVVVLVGLVLIFKTQIGQLAETIFEKIAADSTSILA